MWTKKLYCRACIPKHWWFPNDLLASCWTLLFCEMYSPAVRHSVANISCLWSLQQQGHGRAHAPSCWCLQRVSFFNGRTPLPTNDIRPMTSCQSTTISLVAKTMKIFRPVLSKHRFSNGYVSSCQISILSIAQSSRLESRGIRLCST